MRARPTSTKPAGRAASRQRGPRDLRDGRTTAAHSRARARRARQPASLERRVRAPPARGRSAAPSVSARRCTGAASGASAGSRGSISTRPSSANSSASTPANASPHPAPGAVVARETGEVLLAVREAGRSPRRASRARPRRRREARGARRKRRRPTRGSSASAARRSRARRGRPRSPAASWSSVWSQKTGTTGAPQRLRERTARVGSSIAAL